MKNILRLIAIGTISLGIILITKTDFTQAAARDCDGNAVIYCGVLSKTELEKAYRSGTGKKYQSGTELTSLFTTYGASSQDIPALREGRVTKDGKVFVGTKVVASGVLSTGRHKTANSKQVSGVSYPLYERPPSDSFLSNSIDAFVLINYDGSMAYAIIKSCGNPVRGVGIRKAPTPTVSIKIQKFEDKNENKKRDFAEKYLSGWSFNVAGPGVSKAIITDQKGTATLSGLKTGRYTVTEVQKNGWKNTTGIAVTRDVTTNLATQTFAFGNIKKQPTPLPEDPGGGDTPPEPEIEEPETIQETLFLPVTGPAEVAASALAFVLTGGILYWINSKVRLRKSKRKK